MVAAERHLHCTPRLTSILWDLQLPLAAEPAGPCVHRVSCLLPGCCCPVTGALFLPGERLAKASAALHSPDAGGALASMLDLTTQLVNITRSPSPQFWSVRDTQCWSYCCCDIGQTTIHCFTEALPLWPLLIYGTDAQDLQPVKGAICKAQAVQSVCAFRLIWRLQEGEPGQRVYAEYSTEWQQVIDVMSQRRKIICS